MTSAVVSTGGASGAATTDSGAGVASGSATISLGFATVSLGFVASGTTGGPACGTAGGAGGLGRVITGAGGRGTDCGVISRGAGFASAAGVGGAIAGAEIGGAGFGGTADGGATEGRPALGVAWAGGAIGRGGAGGCLALSVIAFSTSPGLEMCDRSILGLKPSGALGATRAAWPAPDSCSWKYFFTRSASSSSMELECVFFSVTPILGRTSRISLLLTSSSLARSLIRILCCIPPCFLRFVPSGYFVIASSRFSGQWPVTSGQLGFPSFNSAAESKISVFWLKQS